MLPWILQEVCCFLHQVALLYYYQTSWPKSASQPPSGPFNLARSHEINHFILRITNKSELGLSYLHTSLLGICVNFLLESGLLYAIFRYTPCCIILFYWHSKMTSNRSNCFINQAVKKSINA